MKVCTKCNVAKPESQFFRRAAAADGLQSYCKECSRSARSEHRQQNAEHHRAYQREWARSHPEYVLEKGRRARAARPHLSWESKYRHRMRRVGLVPVLVSFTRGELIEAYGDACVYCGGAFEEIDHVIPVRAGGHHVLSNVRPSCMPCNRAKQDRIL